MIEKYEIKKDDIADRCIFFLGVLIGFIFGFVAFNANEERVFCSKLKAYESVLDKKSADYQSATLASTLIISSGATVAPPPPGTNGNAATAIAIIDPPTLAAAYAGLIADKRKGYSRC